MNGIENLSAAELERQNPEPRPIDSEDEFFFAKSGGLGICINPGKMAMGEGEKMIRVGYKFVQFQEQANGFGRLITSDPEVKKALRKRTDVFDTAEYERRSTPIEVRERMMREQNARLITENNSLLAQLQAQGKLPSHE